MVCIVIYENDPVFTREMSRRFATVNMSCRVIESLLGAPPTSRQNSYDKRPVFNILFTAFQNGKCLYNPACQVI